MTDSRSSAPPRRQYSRIAATLRKLAWQRGRSTRGAISPLTALLIVPVAGSIAIAVEQGMWYFFQRSMQNAVDTAAIAAATNNNASGTGSSYQAEAAAAAEKFGYINGQNNVSVATDSPACPAGAPSGATCYRTQASIIVPIGLSKLVGFAGSDVLGSGRGQKIAASAIAAASAGGQTYCVWSLSTGSNSFQSNGGPRPDLGGCSILSHGDATCNGHNLGAATGAAVGTNSGCGVNQVSGASPLPDPYAARAANIPADSCSGSYPQLFKDKGKWTVAASNQITGSYNWTGNRQLCGDIQLTGDVTLTGTNPVVIVRNGMLDLNGHTFKTASGKSATIVFSGTAGSYSHYPTDTSSSGTGVIDIQAPTSGNWSGVAMYQDPALTSGVSFTYAGNAPAWNLSGLAYFPKAALTFSGVVNKSSSGASCFALVSYSILVNGTANIFANNTGCAAAGLTLPTSPSSRPVLVQ